MMENGNIYRQAVCRLYVQATLKKRKLTLGNLLERNPGNIGEFCPCGNVGTLQHLLSQSALPSIPGTKQEDFVEGNITQKYR